MTTIILVLFWIVTVASLQVDDRANLNDLVLKNLINRFRDQVRFTNNEIIEIIALCYQMKLANMERFRTFATAEKRHQNSDTRSVIPYPRIGKRDGVKEFLHNYMTTKFSPLY